MPNQVLPRTHLKGAPDSTNVGRRLMDEYGEIHTLATAHN